jgi:hypothetical protein
MSSKNGDKARYQINRKRAVVRRTKMREMVKAAAAKKDTPAPPASKADAE